MSNNWQILKFFLTAIAAIIGVILYYPVGTLGGFIICYLVSVIISRVANIGYHRWLTHAHIAPGRTGRYLLLWSMVATNLSPPLKYVIGHRLHHKYSDTANDPHHTGLGLFSCLIGNFNTKIDGRVGVKDILRQPDVMFVDKYFYLLHFLNLSIFLLISVKFFLLSFLLLNMRAWVNVAIFNYVAHNGFSNLAPSPQNLPTWACYLAGYNGEQLHKNHHDYPANPDFGSTSLLNMDITYHIMKHVVKVNKQNKI